MSVVEIRVIGTPEDAERIVETLHEHLDVIRTSRPYSCRGDADRVRVYVDIECREVSS